MNHILITEKNYEAFMKVLPLYGLQLKNRHAIGAYSDEGVVAGAISFTLADDRYFLDWLYVIPEYRNRGIATGLIHEIFSFIKTTGYIYPIEAEFEVADSNAPIYGMFISNEEFDVRYSHKRFYIEPKELSTSKALSKEYNIVYDEEFFFKLDKERQEKVLSQVNKENLLYIADYDEWKMTRAGSLCRVLSHDGKVVGCVFFNKRTDKYLELTYIFGKSSIVTMYMIITSAKLIMQEYPGYGIVYDTVGKGTESLSKKVFPDGKFINIYTAEWL